WVSTLSRRTPVTWWRDPCTVKVVVEPPRALSSAWPRLAERGRAPETSILAVAVVSSARAGGPRTTRQRSATALLGNEDLAGLDDDGDLVAGLQPEPQD